MGMSRGVAFCREGGRFGIAKGEKRGTKEGESGVDRIFWGEEGGKRKWEVSHSVAFCREGGWGGVVLWKAASGWWGTRAGRGWGVGRMGELGVVVATRGLYGVCLVCQIEGGWGFSNRVKGGEGGGVWGWGFIGF